MPYLKRINSLPLINHINIYIYKYTQVSDIRPSWSSCFFCPESFSFFNLNFLSSIKHPTAKCWHPHAVPLFLKNPNQLFLKCLILLVTNNISQLSLTSLIQLFLKSHIQIVPQKPYLFISQNLFSVISNNSFMIITQ